MIAAIPRSLIDEFERSASEARRRKISLRQELEDEANLRRERTLEKVRDEEREFWDQLKALATPLQVAEFNVKLESYDRATVEALMENTRALDDVHERMEKLRSEAFTLPDGRKVFATARGDEVFYENGSRVGLDVIDPLTIPAKHPKWEQVNSLITERAQLDQVRTDLLGYQAKLDATHERSASGDMSKKDLDDLEANLKATMPPSVAAHLPHAPSETPDATVSRYSDAPAIEASDLKVPPRSAPAYRP